MRVMPRRCSRRPSCAVHPLGKSPVIEDEGRVLAESGAIVEYLVDKAGGRLGAPADSDDALRYRMFLHYAEGSLMPPLLLKLVLSRVPIMGKIALKRIQPMIDVHLDFVERELAARPWLPVRR
jgi:glutathione S-transferase